MKRRRTFAEEPLVVQETHTQDQRQEVEEVVVSGQNDGDLENLLRDSSERVSKCT
jgi:hypothetical protein